jgi:N-acetylmuramoyl-L-alanine amidase
LGDPTRRSTLRVAQHGLLVLLLVVIAAIGLLVVRRPADRTQAALATEVAGATWTPKPRPQLPRATAASPRSIGIIPGHWKSDSGAVCDDLTEADVTLSVANKVKTILERFGYRVQLLPEFSPDLKGFQADLLLSIHADSCKHIEGASGFKVARAANSAIPEIEDRLVECLWTEYEAVTQLPRHPGSITDDMLYYHAFNEVAAQTPAAIIEIGFMAADKAILVFGQESIAQGISNAIICFLE